MSNTISKLVELDKQCSLKVEEAKNTLAKVNHDHLNKQKELNEQMLHYNEKELLRHKETIDKENQIEMDLLMKEQINNKAALDETFSNNKQRYIDELVARCLK